MDLIDIDMRKWPDRPHWQYPAQKLGEDEHGIWAHVPGGTVARRGEEPPTPLPSGFILLVPHRAWWIVEFYQHHPWCDTYVNIGTPPVWEGEVVRQIDLDLDVVRKVDGTIEVLDEDEFAEHQVAYPKELVDQARRATDQAVIMLRTQQESYATAVATWREYVERIGEGSV